MDVSRETNLEKSFGFTPDDLKQNRHGELSAAQIGRLRRQATQIAIIVIAVLSVVAILAIVSAQPDTSDVPLALFCLIVPGLITLVATIGVTEAAVTPRVVSKRIGQIHLAYGFMGYDPPVGVEQQRKAQRLMLGRRGAYTMIIDDQEFTLTQEQHSALRPGLDAEVYFVPTVHKIVSIELTDDADRHIPLPIQPPTSITQSPLDDTTEDVLKA